MRSKLAQSAGGLPDADPMQFARMAADGASRREMLRLLLAGDMSLAAARSLLGATLAQAPRKGGRIKVAGGSIAPNDTVDPAKQSFSTNDSRCSTFCNGLTALDGALEPQSELAESFSHDKALVWTFKQRKGVTFHNGAEMTADDVVYSLNRHKDAAVASRANALAKQMNVIKASGKHEVTITLEAPNADLPVILGTWHFLIIKNGTTDFKTANGTGLYKVKEFTPDVRTVGERNVNYFKAGKRYVGEIELIGISDETARVSALVSGDGHLIAGISPRSIRQIQASPGYSVFETKAGYYTNLVMRQDADPTRNLDFMMAMKHLFNREEIRSSVFRGFAVLGNDQPTDPSNRYYRSGLPQRAFDLDKAKRHFQKSGIGKTPVPMNASPAAPGSVEMGVLLQEAASKFGLNIGLQQVLAATLVACTAGAKLGLLAAVAGGALDAALSRALDALIAIPSLLFGLVVVAAFGTSLLMLVLTAAVIYTPGAYRFARSLAVNANATDFVVAARAGGEATGYIMAEEVLPNIIDPILADFGLRFVFVILLLSRLSVHGLGIQPPHADWGSLARDNISGLAFAAPAVVVPAFATASLTIGANMLIDALQLRAPGALEEH
jgi:peptide/nickel transport system substrate-binding protein